MAVDFLLILLFKTEQDLRRHDALVGVFKMQILVEPERCRVLEQVGGDGLVVDHVLHMTTRLVDAEQGEAVKHARMNLFAPVSYDTHYDLRSVNTHPEVEEDVCIPSSRRQYPMSASSCAYTNARYSA